MPLFGGEPNVEELKAKRNVKGLIKALGYKKDGGVRIDAAKALGQISDTRAVEPLNTALRDEHMWVRKAAAEALGQIGDARAVEPLIAILKDKKKDVRKATAEALGQIGDARAVEPLIAALKDWHVRQVAAGVLGQIGDPRAVEPLIATLKDESKHVRRAAAEGLVRMYKTGQLSEAHKRLILTQRDTITQRHVDRHTDMSCLAHVDSHTDEGIGVDFPF